MKENTIKTFFNMEMNNVNFKFEIKFVISLIAIAFLVIIINVRVTIAQDYDSKLDIAYSYLNDGKTSDAIDIFEDHLKSYPDDIKIYMQLAYAYKQIGNNEKAKEYFTFVSLRSPEPKDVLLATTELDNLKSLNHTASVDKSSNENPVTNNLLPSDDDDLLNQGYNYVNLGKYRQAIIVFEDYKLKHPADTKIYLQLGYLYCNVKNYSKAIENFQYIEAFSTNSDEIDKARTSIYNIRLMRGYNANRSLDLYFFNEYDSYYQNYISNLLGHINFRMAKNAFIGFYGDAYMDARSRSDYILNDRYLEAGGFIRLNFTENIGLEIRTGYAHEIDLQKNSFVFKPILFMGTRLGEPPFYLSRKDFRTEYFYMDIYSAELYDSKFRNLFAQLQLKEVLRYMTGGYSYLEFYLCQQASADSRQLDYNNYGEFGIGMDFKPNMLNFPALFVEATNKIYIIGPAGQYFQGSLRNTFQFKAGFIINFNTRL